MSEMPNSLLLGSDILSVPWTSRSLDICLVLTVSPHAASDAPPLENVLEEVDSDEDLASVSQISVQGASFHSYRGLFPEVSEVIGATHKRWLQPPCRWCEHPWMPPPMPYALHP